MLFQEPGLEFGVTAEDAGERVRVEAQVTNRNELAEPVAPAVDVDDVDVVQQAPEDRRGQDSAERWRERMMEWRRAVMLRREEE